MKHYLLIAILAISGCAIQGTDPIDANSISIRERWSMIRLNDLSRTWMKGQTVDIRWKDTPAFHITQISHPVQHYYAGRDTQDDLAGVIEEPAFIPQGPWYHRPAHSFVVIDPNTVIGRFQQHTRTGTDMIDVANLSRTWLGERK